MEKIKVNMTPTGFTPTIHASQGDGSDRKWAFDLYDENGKIDGSDIKEQMIFDSRVGGTEQILPENTADPTTSPIIADIQYPDGFRSEQEFTYRQSPTTEDGKAKITRIKGNSVVVNQLVENGNFASTSGISATSNITISTSNNILSVQNTASDDGGRYAYQTISNIVQGHKYFIKFSANVGSSTESVIFALTGSLSITAVGNSGQGWNTQSQMANASATGTAELRYRNAQHGTTNQYRNVMIMDLTFMGIDNLTTTTEVEEWLSSHIGNLPYYAYTTGKLLPFKGESLKTTGKNLLPYPYLFTTQTKTGITLTANSDGSVSASGTSTASVSQRFDLVYLTLEKGSYIFTGFNPKTGVYATLRDGNSGSWIANISGSYALTVTERKYYLIALNIQEYAETNITYYPMIRFANVTDNTFEPYTENTTSLSILDYFPTGMKRAPIGIYDELTENHASKRLDIYTFTGNEGWIAHPNGRWYADFLPTNLTTARDGRYFVLSLGAVFSYTSDYGNYYNIGSTGIYFNKIDSSETMDQFKARITGSAMIYVLASYVETEITTASLVSEQTELPMETVDGQLIAECSSDFSSKVGMTDCKIKLMNDETIYSQKIQLHVERKP